VIAEALARQAVDANVFLPTVQCQATWLYLEPIFSSDDIVKQMPEEGDKFRAVDGTWRAVMTATAASPAVLPLGRDAGTLARLREANGLLDEVQKGLAAYLEKKRLFFPRRAFTVRVVLSWFA
jgi:dynein heavy chain, axonemal